MNEKNKALFGRLPDGRAVEEIFLDNGSISCRVLTYGGALRSLAVPDCAGRPVDVLLGVSAQVQPRPERDCRLLVRRGEEKQVSTRLSMAQDVEAPVEQGQTLGQLEVYVGDELRDTMLYIARHAEAAPLHLIGHLCLFLDGLIRSSATRKTLHGGKLKDFYIQEAINFMEHNYQRDLTVEEIANVCRLNRGYFSKLFKESMGCPPQEFLIRLRMAKAADMMKGTRQPIGIIAAKCRFEAYVVVDRCFVGYFRREAGESVDISGKETGVDSLGAVGGCDTGLGVELERSSISGEADVFGQRHGLVVRLDSRAVAA